MLTTVPSRERYSVCSTATEAGSKPAGMRRLANSVVEAVLASAMNATGGRVND